jgi:hypothetical protein
MGLPRLHLGWSDGLGVDREHAFGQTLLFGGPARQRQLVSARKRLLTLNGGNAIAARCRDSRLDLGLVTYERYSTQLATALEGARQSGSFDGVKY